MRAPAGSLIPYLRWHVVYNLSPLLSRPFLEATLKAPRGGQFIIIIMMIMIIMIMIIIITVKVMCPGPSSKPPSRRLEEDNL